MALAFYDMIFSKTNNLITLINSGLVIDFISDYFPSIIKSMLVISVLRYKINKII